MWCAYPRCFQEPCLRCVTCGRLYCADHCAHLLFEAGMVLHECNLCHEHLSLEEVRLAHPPGLLASIVGITLLLTAVALGIAVDVSTRGSGFIALWTFALAFLVASACLHH